MKNISFVIPTYNSEKTIERCLKAAKSLKSINKEIIVVDDDSVDNTVKIASKYADLVIQIKHRGAATARNVGWKNAKYENIIFLDSDIIVNQKWLQKILKEMDKYDVLIPGKGSSLIGPDIKTFRIPRDFMVTKKHILERIGGYSKIFPWAGGEDVDILLRALKSKFRCKCVDCNYVNLGVGRRSAKKTLHYWIGGLIMNLKNIDTIIAKQWLLRKMVGITPFEYLKKTIKRMIE